ncbi:neurocan core protein-like isoform X2 [Macrobrachium nipponense]|uniref:neurocan core protein-like isoform X2 n=1 Tax=Macrobrachium nipponense TaxID=159736 RepID=UPI0030C8D097
MCTGTIYKQGCGEAACHCCINDASLCVLLPDCENSGGSCMKPANWSSCVGAIDSTDCFGDDCACCHPTGKIGNSGFWIGLNDRATENSFKWCVDNSAVEDNGNYSSWAVGQPNDNNGQDCVVIYSDDTWNDDECYSDHCK